MVAIVSLLIVVMLSLLIARIATVALTATGLSSEAARFQARSALTGVGFTTSEAERVVRHPVRRRIVMLLMLIGNAGLVTIIASVIIGFGGSGGSARVLVRLALLLAGITAIWILSRREAVDRWLTRVAVRVLRRWGDIEVRTVHLLDLSRQHVVAEVPVRPGDPLADRPLAQLPLRDVIVLGVRTPGGEYIGEPRDDQVVTPGQTLIVYGRTGSLAELNQRRAAGDRDARDG